MTRQELKKFIYEIYDIIPDYPWLKYPSYEVFRHVGNKKWFAVIMDIPKTKLGINEDGNISVVNLKCDAIMLRDALSEKGIYPAYHMNKNHWNSIILDGTVPDQDIKRMIAESYDLTKGKVK